MAEPQLLATAGCDVLSAIVGRASIRRFTQQPVDEAQLTTILNAGFCAPSSSNKQPWHFVVVHDADTRRAIAEAGDYAAMVADAPVAIVVCGDGMLQGVEDMRVADCAAATENMLLAAHGLGLGAVWCGVMKTHRLVPTLRRLLCLPERVQPTAIIALGHPAKERPRPARYMPGRVHSERW